MTSLLPGNFSALDHYISYRLPEIEFQSLAAGDFHSAVIEAEQVEDGGVNVGHVVAILDGVEAEFVGRAVDDAALNAAAGQSDRKAVRMMIAAIAPLRAGRAAELRRDHDERLVEQAALLEVTEQRPDRLIDLLGRACCDQLAGSHAQSHCARAAVVAVKDLHEPHAALDEPAGDQSCCPNVFVSFCSRPNAVCVAADSVLRSTASGTARCI